MKKVTIAVASLFAAASFTAVAAPVEMTKKEMSKVVAGAQPETRGGGLTTAGEARGLEAKVSPAELPTTGRTAPPIPGGGNVNKPAGAP
jgi:hypothetical protein